MMLPLLWQMGQGFAPGDCILTGLCGVQAATIGPPPGLMFVAIGLVGLGWFGLRSRNR
jgi:hypothetical protein